MLVRSLRTNENIKIMKRIKWALGLIVGLLIMAGCSKDKSADVADLLKTIPSDASMVAVIDLETIIKEMDCSVSNGVIKPGKDVAQALESSKNGDTKETLEKMNKAGIDWTVAAVFAEGYNVYLTGFLSDSSKFKDAVEEQFGEKWESGEVNTCGNVAVEGERFWVCLNSRNTIVANDIRHFNTLSDNQSILSNKNVSKLKDLDSEVAGWGDISGLLNLAGLPFSSRAAVKLGLETMFEDAVELEWEIDLDGDELKAEIEIINNKGGIAKFNFPVEKVNGDVVKKLAVSGDGFGAIVISKKMIEQIKAETSKESFSLIGAFVNMMLGCVDGTASFAISNQGAMTGIISTNGHNTTDLVDALKQFGMNVDKEGDALRISQGGEVTGVLSAAEAADMLKGSVMGVAFGGFDELSQLKNFSLTFHSDKGGLKGEINAKGKDPKKKFLLNFLN